MIVYRLFYFTQLVMQSQNLWEVTTRLNEQFVQPVELHWQTAEDKTEYAIVRNWIVVRETK